MRHLYSLIMYLLLPFALLHLYWLEWRNPGQQRRWHERLGAIDMASRPVIWLHAASVGEVQAAVPLINRLLDTYPHYQVVVTTMTPTGARTVEQRLAQSVTHKYLPYDLGIFVRRYLRRMQPEVLLVMEMELWPNLFHECRRSNIPVVLVNARMSPRSAAGYARLPSLTRQLLADVSLIAAQGQADADRLVGLGAARDRTQVIGNLKFDIRLPPSFREQAEVLRRDMAAVNRPVWIAASTHEGEDELVLETHGRLLRHYADCLLLLAPRHPERCERVAALCQRSGFATARRSRRDSVNADTAVYLVDTLGELQICYAAADIAFVGGSFVEAGGHNPLEPASAAVPILTGPHYFNNNDIMQVLQKHGACRVAHDGDELFDHLCRLFDDANLRYQAGEQGRGVVLTNAGGVDRLLALLSQYLHR